MAAEVLLAGLGGADRQQKGGSKRQQQQGTRQAGSHADPGENSSTVGSSSANGSDLQRFLIEATGDPMDHALTNRKSMGRFVKP
jgi:hypothetical protein